MMPTPVSTIESAVVIGASAGALDALSAIIPKLPADYPRPVLVVVHLPPDKKSVLAELLGSKSKLKVCEASDKDPLQPGMVYIAPPDYHMLVEKDGSVALSVDEPVQYSRPAIDVLFESAADAFGRNLVGVVLTGANSDGAAGLKAIINRGGFGIIQRPDLAYAAAMPEAAIAACPTALVLSLDEISNHLMTQLVNKGTPHVA